jgi:hypothetical protein
MLQTLNYHCCWLESEANDGWCENPGTWNDDQIEWAKDVDQLAKHFRERISELVQRAHKIAAARRPENE